MIRLEDFTKEYDLLSSEKGAPRTLVAADRIHLHVPTGEIFGLIGPNGAGKTTILKAICGLLPPTSGRIFVHDIDVEARPDAAQSQLGYLADFFSVYDDLKAWEYLEYFARAHKMPPAKIPARIDEVLGLLTLEAKRDAFISGLSRGMKQRLGIARAILHSPPLLVLDEPASGLDPKARHELKDLLRSFHRAGATIFITSHVLADLEEICTSLAILEKGRLLRSGPIADVMRRDSSALRVRIRLAASDSPFDLSAWLASRPAVSAVQPEPLAAVFLLTGTERDLADLLRALVSAGAPVCAVEHLTESLEQIFSRISSGEVM